MSVTCVPIYGLMFRILTRFHTLYFGASCIHRSSIVWRRVILARFPYWPEKRLRRISQYSYLLETLISSEYGLTISGHVTVLRQWPLEKNTDYIINIIINSIPCSVKLEIQNIAEINWHRFLFQHFEGTCSRLGGVVYTISFYPKLHTSVHIV